MEIQNTLDPRGTLQKVFGYASFRTGQEELVKSILSGRDTLGIMPTGAGKSICFQVPALLLPGITLVISPLISLMHDQVIALNHAGVHAAYLNSSLTASQYEKAMARACQGQYKIIYVAPERLLTPSFAMFVRTARISMVTVDEAHCVSQWGQDFRPSYLDIAAFIDGLPTRPIVSAFTATATTRVEEDIIRLLRLRDPHVSVLGFDRPNLYFDVQAPANRKQTLIRFVHAHREENGVIYCLTRKNVEELCDELIRLGIPATRYHAGLSEEERKRNQEDFIYDRKRVIVATNAFGMGIDKPDVRYVVHYQMPKDLESYYQEAGRAGRDGLDASCLLLYSGQDIMLNRFLIEHSQSENDNLDPQTAMQVRAGQEERLQAMTGYALTDGCYRNYILRYFGEKAGDPCGHCGSCLAEYEEFDAGKQARMILSCMEESGERFGMQILLDVCRGASSERIRSRGLDRLHSFNSLSDEPRPLLQAVARTLQEQGFIAVESGTYAIAHRTAKGSAFQTSDLPFPVRLRKNPIIKPESKKRSAPGDASGNPALYEKLRLLRKSIADQERIPPYIVCSDKTLMDLCRVLPASREELLLVYGIGAAKADKYGEAFLACIRAYRQENHRH